MKNKPPLEKVYLMILDGFGIGKKYKGNAIEKAKMPNLKKLFKEYPFTELKASGNEVGLPRNVMGNSEVGHYTIGAGRITYQSLEEIDRSIKDKSFFQNKVLVEAMKHVKKNNSSLHLLGMISDEGVHAHLNHLFALMDLAGSFKINNVFIHAITDGRDVPERSAKKYLKKILARIEKSTKLHPKTTIKIASLIGRYFAMDRDNNWDRTKKAYDLLISGKGDKESDPLKAIEVAYSAGTETDYYIPPIFLDENGTVKNNDAVIFYNFRTDRPRQLTYAFTEEVKPGFDYTKKIKPYFVCFGDYSKKAKIAFSPPVIKNNLPETLENNKKKQLHIAETEKFAHVTFFFNSQSDKKYTHEKRILIPSPKVASYDKKPEMSAKKITNAVIAELKKNDYAFVIQNFANPDLVGHSGNLEATVKACEVIDECIGKILKTALKNNYHLIITGDHGNA